MNPDPFQFNEHKARDRWKKSISHAIGLGTAGTKFKQAQPIFLTRNVRLPARTCRNLVRNSKLSPDEKGQVTLDSLEGTGFHIRWLKKYLVENDVRQRQVMEEFMFCSPEQIDIRSEVRQWISYPEQTLLSIQMGSTCFLLFSLGSLTQCRVFQSPTSLSPQNQPKLLSLSL